MKLSRRISVILFSLLFSISVFSAHHKNVVIGEVELNEVEHSYAFKRMSKWLVNGKVN